MRRSAVSPAPGRRPAACKESRANPSISENENARERDSWPESRSPSSSTSSLPDEDYRRLVERLPAIIYTAELGEHGRWRYVSPQVEEILGYSPEEWIADPELWAKLLHPDDRERALEQETRKTLGERNPPPVDYRMITRDGEHRLDPRRGGARGRRGAASRSGTASSTTSPSARSPSRS